MAFFRHFLTYGSWRKDVSVLVAVILLCYVFFGHLIRPGGETVNTQAEEYTSWDHLADTLQLVSEMRQRFSPETFENMSFEERQAALAEMALIRQQMEANEKRRQATRAAEEAAVRDWFMNFDAAD